MRPLYVWFPRIFAPQQPKLDLTGGEQLEAVKLIHEWSKWLVTIETAAVGGIGALWKFGSSPEPSPHAASFAIAAIVLFGISIVGATRVLLALPGIVQRLHRFANWDVFHMGTLNGGGTRLYILVQIQVQFFILGLTAFAFFLLEAYLQAGSPLLLWGLLGLMAIWRFAPSRNLLGGQGGAEPPANVDLPA